MLPAGIDGQKSPTQWVGPWRLRNEISDASTNQRSEMVLTATEFAPRGDFRTGSTRSRTCSDDESGALRRGQIDEMRSGASIVTTWMSSSMPTGTPTPSTRVSVQPS